MGNVQVGYAHALRTNMHEMSQREGTGVEFKAV